MNNAVLQLTNITRTYRQGGKELTVLRDYNLTLKQSEIVALVGQSGSGKSTLLQIAGLLDTPTSGDITIMGEQMSRMREQARTMIRRKYIGFIYQFHHLLPEFSALENVVLPQLISGVSKSVSEEKAKALLSSLGLAERFTHRPAALSGGEQQRVAIARALANDPALILADEPTGNLDPATSDIVFDILLKAAREYKVAMLVATHNMTLAGKMDRVIHLK